MSQKREEKKFPHLVLTLDEIGETKSPNLLFPRKHRILPPEKKFDIFLRPVILQDNPDILGVRMKFQGNLPIEWERLVVYQVSL